jgi:hypothetical protein
MFAAFSNASPIVQPSFNSSLPRAVVVVVPEEAPFPASAGPVRADTPERRDRQFETIAHVPLKTL